MHEAKGIIEPEFGSRPQTKLVPTILPVSPRHIAECRKRSPKPQIRMNWLIYVVIMDNIEHCLAENADEAYFFQVAGCSYTAFDSLKEWPL